MNYTDTERIQISDSFPLREVLNSHGYGSPQSVGEFTPIDSGLVHYTAGIRGRDDVGPDIFGIIMGEPVIADLLISIDKLYGIIHGGIILKIGLRVNFSCLENNIYSAILCLNYYNSKSAGQIY